MYQEALFEGVCTNFCSTEAKEGIIFETAR